MRRDGKVCWAGFIMSSITIAFVIIGTILLSEKSTVFNFDPSNSVKAEQGEKSDRFDHRAHAVPGKIYKATDFSGAGEVQIALDGSLSHTHYVDEGPPLVNGKIVNLVWFDNATHLVLGTGLYPKVPFKVGTTVLGLTVADNTRDTQTDYTKVIIKSPIISGVFCYFYKAGVLNDDISKGPRPIFAAERARIDFKSIRDFPNKVPAGSFASRCIFQTSLRSGTKILIRHVGPIRFLLDGKPLILSSTTASTSTATYSGPPKKLKGQLIYSRGSGEARLQVTSGVNKLEYDASKSLPIVTRIDPGSSTLDGGGKAKIEGIALANNVKVFFGTQEAKYDKDALSADGNSVTVTVPKPSADGPVKVAVENKNGRSNELPFEFSESGLQPIKFKRLTITHNGKPYKSQQITGIKYGPDHKYYVSVYNSRIISFKLNQMMEIEGDICQSPSLGQNRKVLGLAFNYESRHTRLYVTTCTLKWKSDGLLDGDFAWANGEVHILEPGAGKKCLVKLEKPIITGLPVSNYDHGVNGLVFDDDGNLHIQVGGTTNAGHNGLTKGLGGIDESPLSGASLIATVNKNGFDGFVTYSSREPGLAKQTGGFDVQVYSPGWRSSYGINIHSNGYLYATDNGAGHPFGEMSTSCTTHRPLPGTTNLSDKLGKVIKGKYYGHPNRNRGRTDPKQCKFMPDTEKTTSHYQAPLLTLESSTNGVLEYTADTFLGQLKGDLLLSKHAAGESAGKIYRVKLDGAGDAKGKEEILWKESGLSIEQTPYGDIISPRIWREDIVVLRPITLPTDEQTFRAVSPARGSFKGGNQVIVTGFNIGSNPVATFNGKKCTDVKDVSATSFKCRVPPGVPNAKVKVSIVSISAGTAESSGGHDYKYMKI